MPNFLLSFYWKFDLAPIRTTTPGLRRHIIPATLFHRTHRRVATPWEQERSISPLCLCWNKITETGQQYFGVPRDRPAVTVWDIRPIAAGMLMVLLSALHIPPRWGLLGWIGKAAFLPMPKSLFQIRTWNNSRILIEREMLPTKNSWVVRLLEESPGYYHSNTLLPLFRSAFCAL